MKIWSLLKMLRYWFVFYIVFFSTCSQGIEVSDLYVAKVAVGSQSNAEKNGALKRAMQAVILKVSGQSTTIEYPQIKIAIERYKTFVTQYYYQRDADNLQLVVSFDEAKINALFVEANLPLWGRLRPQILLWILDEQGLLRTILSESTPSNLPNVVQRFSALRGLPVIMPIMDLTDAMQITTADLWGRFVEPIKLASARYMAEAVVIIRISDSSLLPQVAENVSCELLCQQSNYALDWSFISDTKDNNSQHFGKSYQGVDKQELIEIALSDITENIYQRYALSTNINNALTIDVANVDSLATYMEVSSFLTQLSSVQSVTLVKMQGTNSRFNLTLLGTRQSLIASLKLNNRLQQYIDPLANKDQSGVPVFNWRQP